MDEISNPSVPGAEQEIALLRADVGKYASSVVSSIVGVTSQLFGKVEIIEDCEPEFADEKFVVFVVTSSEDVATLAAKEREWVAQLQRIAPN